MPACRGLMKKQQFLNLVKGSSIARRVLLVLLVAVVLSNAVVIFSTVSTLEQQLLERRQQQLGAEAERLSLQFDAYIGELLRDVAFLRHAPAVAGLLESRAVDAKSAASAHWRDHLQQAFLQMLAAKPMSVQIRLIDASGQEVVRVDRYGSDGQVRIVADADLQNKAHRDYVQAGLALPEDVVWLSDIGLNRENHQIMQPPHAVIRAVTPVYDSQGQRRGVIVVNHRLEEMFSRIGEAAQDELAHYIVRSGGDYLLHPDRSKTFRFEYGERSTLVDDLPEADQFLADANRQVWQTQTNVGDQRRLFALKKLGYQLGSTGQQLAVVVSLPYRDAMVVSRELLKKQSVFVVTTLLVFLALATILAQKIVAPLQHMRTVIQQKGRATRAEDLPVDAYAEVGALAREFSALLDELTTQQRALENEVVQRRAVQTELEQNLGRVARANKELEQFAYIASHDLQEPLRTIKSFVGLFEQKNAENFDEQSQQFLAFINQSASRMELLINGLLEYSRLGQDAPWEPVNCQSLVAGVCDDLAVQIRERGANVRFRGLPTIVGHAASLRMLFQNLIGNGLKYVKDDVVPCVEINAQACDGGWKFCVKDNGIGIDEAHRERVFLIFQRLHGREDFPGTGIGLAQCKKIVEQHGGNIWIESAGGGGSCFCFTLFGEQHGKT